MNKLPASTRDGFALAGLRYLAASAVGAWLAGARGRCKWGVVGERDLAVLRERANALPTELKGVREIQLALFSGREGAGAADRRIRAEARAGRVALWTGADLLPE